ncbi:MAG: TraR/DksA family transcriptional regulator [Candidatus Theseobacter exili]|nr:TraR/DksA family transcriptional regulator [Candidatus Theseobacter exili]
MEKKKSEQYKNLLLALRERLSGDVSHLIEENLKKSQKEMSGDLSGYSLHIADMGSDDFDRTLALGMLANDQEIIYMIDTALEKIESGNYGICEKSGTKISERRLKAVPWAPLCKECQEEDERSA